MHLINVDALAQEICSLNGKHSLGAGAMAEALLPFIKLLTDTAVQDAIADFKEKAATSAEALLKARAALAVPQNVKTDAPYLANTLQIGRDLLDEIYVGMTDLMPDGYFDELTDE